MQQIKDYLQIQGLDADADSTAAARAAAQAVILHGQVSADPAALWQNGRLDAYLARTPENETLLKQLLMALDSVCSRTQPQSAALYGITSDGSRLTALSSQGLPLESELPLESTAAETHLAARTAQSAWLNLADDTAAWLAEGHLSGEHNRRSGSQISLPVSAEDGRTYGVLHIEKTRPGGFTAEEQAEWIGLALAVLPLLQQLFPKPESQNTAPDEETYN